MNSQRTKLQKAILWALLAMAVVFAVAMAVVRSRPGALFEETLLRITQDGEKSIYTGRAGGEEVTIVTYPEGNGHVVELTVGTVIDHRYRVDYPGGTITNDYGAYDRVDITCNGAAMWTGGYSAAAPFSFCGADGEPELLVHIRVGGSAGMWNGYEMSADQVMRFATGPDTAVRGSWLLYGAAVVCSLICAVCTAFPDKLFYLKHFLTVRDPKPTDLYIELQKGVCIVLAVSAFCIYLYGLFYIIV